MIRSHKETEKLTKDEQEFIRTREKCPDCEEGRLGEGPHGGCSINWYCLNSKCGSKFNDLGVFGWERISDASPNNPNPREPQWSPYHEKGPYR